MPNCPFCLERIKAGARKCPHCQTSLEAAQAADDNAIYVLDKGLVKFAKFAGGVLAIFVVMGIYLFGLDIKEASETTSKAKLDVQEAVLQLGIQKSALEDKIEEVEKAIEKFKAIEAEISSHRDEVQRSSAEVKLLLSELRGYREEGSRLLIELRTLGGHETTIAVTKREERGIGAERGKLWAVGSSLRFRFLDGDERLKTTVRHAVDEWAKYVNLTFVEVQSDDAEIRVSFSEPGSWSFVGTDALGVPADDPTLNYGFLAELNQTEARQTALHEFGHALGLEHEFQNPAAGDVFDLKAVKAEFEGPPNFWDDKAIKKNFTDKANYPGARPYDPRSIMNYSFPRSIFLPGKETSPGDGLSDSDKNYVTSLYPKG